jgi:DNA polymerase-1
MCGIRKHDQKGVHDLVRSWLKADELLLIGANVPFDMAVFAAAWPDLLPFIFEAYEQNRVTDVQTRQQLIDLAKGQLGGWRNAATGQWKEYRYSLADLVMRHLGEDRSLLKHGPDVWRMRYRELHDVPLDEWPKEAISYAVGDAEDTLAVYEAQQPDAQFLEDEFRQARAHFALHLMSCRGIRTDPKAIESYESRIREELEESKQIIVDMGWLVPKKKSEPDGEHKRSIKAVHAYCEKEHKTMARTPTGKPKLDEESVKQTQDNRLVAFQHYSSAKTVLKKVEELWEGVDVPIQAKFNVLVAGGRTSCRGTNIQARTRKPGDRECFVPRPGWVFGNADYDGLELRTNGQVCIWIVGYSKLADALNVGNDPHLMFAGDRWGLSYKDAVIMYKKEKEEGLDPEDAETFLFARQMAKMGNFGFTAGLGAAGFVKHTQDKGLTVCGKPNHNKKKRPAYDGELLCHECLDGAEALREDWFVTWPEMREYFNWIRALLGRAGHATVKHFMSERYRGLIGYTATANTFSQGLGADATKAALFVLSRDCYIGNSPLRGCFPINYVHDEFILEMRDDERAHDSAIEMARVMTEEANKWLPDVPTTATPLLMRRWSKRAQPLYDDNGRLVPWDCEV